MPWPILRTPTVALSEVINLLEPNEIVTASFCSQNFKRLLKRHYQPSSKLELSLKNAGSCTELCGRGRMLMSARHISELNGAATHKSIGINEYKIKFGWDCPILYFEDRVMGTKMIVELVTDLFSSDIRRMIIDRNSTWAIDWVLSRQEKPLSDLNLHMADEEDTVAEDEAAKYVFRNASTTKILVITVNLSENFQFAGQLGSLTDFSIWGGHSVTCDNLMNIDATSICVCHSRLRFADINSFLGHWRSGGSARLEVVHVFFQENTFPEVFDADLEVVETDEVRVYPCSYGTPIELRGGYSIQRMDGVKATINFNHPRMFLMAVWNERAVQMENRF